MVSDSGMPGKEVTAWTLEPCAENGVAERIFWFDSALRGVLQAEAGCFCRDVSELGAYT